MLESLYVQGRWEDPPIAGDEVAILLGFLERQRATFAWKCDGLDAAGLHSTLGASAMTLGGMLKHLARFEDDMSTEWLYGREQPSPWNGVDWDADPTWDGRTAAEDSPEQLYTLWRPGAAGGSPGTEPALYPAQHDRGIRAPQRPRRSHP